jgi:hypothetical protein
VGISFLTPWAGFLVLAAALPLGALWLLERRSRAVLEATGAAGPGRRSWLPYAAAIGALTVLLALAVMQPVLLVDQVRHERTDAEAWVIVDTTRSMLAASGPGAENRFARARAFAENVRERLADIPVGLATITDRTLPNVYPTTDETAYKAALERSIGVGRPPPGGYEGVGTAFEALATVQNAQFFDEEATKRLIIVVSDGETRPLSAQKLAQDLAGPPRITPLFVQVWRPEEQVYVDGAPDALYQPDLQSAATVRQLAAATSGAAYTEDDLDDVVAKSREVLGEGETSSRTIGSRRHALAPWLLVLAALPLGFLVLRRNA